MKPHLKPRWNSLSLIGLILGAALLWEVRLPLSPAGHSWLVGLWVLAFHGILASWITANRQALEQAPRPRDMIGRPVIELDAPILHPYEGTEEQIDVRHVPRRLHQLETQ